MAYPNGTPVSYNNCPCLYLQQVINQVNQEKEYTKTEPGVIALLKDPANKAASPIKDGADITNNDGKTQDTAHPGRFDFVYYAQDCSTTQPGVLGACAPAESGTAYKGKTTLQYDLGKNYTFSIQINTQDDIDKCYSTENMRQEIFAARMYSVLSDLECQILAEIAATIGGYASQTPPTNSLSNPAVLNFLNPGTLSSPNLATGLQVGRQYFRQKNKDTQLSWVGQSVGIVELANEEKPFPSLYLSDCLNDTIADLTGIANVEYLLGIPKGTYLLKTWNQYVGKYAIPMGTRSFTEKATIELWGFKWDVTYTRTQCLDVWHFQLNYGIVKAPNINCGNRDALNFLVGCGVTSCEELGAIFGNEESFSGG